MKLSAEGLERGANEAVLAELRSLAARAKEVAAPLEARGMGASVCTPAAAEKAVAECWSAAAPMHKTIDAQTLSGPEAAVLDPTPEEREAQTAGLLAVLRKDGVRAAIQNAESSGDPWLADDFHQLLVAYTLARCS